jgi:hypothetical protein
MECSERRSIELPFDKARSVVALEELDGLTQQLHCQQEILWAPRAWSIPDPGYYAEAVCRLFVNMINVATDQQGRDRKSIPGKNRPSG